MVATKETITELRRREKELARRLFISRGLKAGPEAHQGTYAKCKASGLPELSDGETEAALAELSQVNQELNQSVTQFRRQTELAQQQVFTEEGQRTYSDLSDAELRTAAQAVKDEIAAARVRLNVIGAEIRRRAGDRKLLIKLGELSDLDKQRLSQLLSVEAVKPTTSVNG